MKRLFFLIQFLCVVALGNSQGYYTKYYADSNLKKDAAEWVKSKVWSGAFDKAVPHESVNPVDFYQQYTKNKAQWDAAFEWLAKNDLVSIPKGKYPIEGTSLVVSVEESENGPLEKRESESHYHKIDLQYCVSGIERFGVIDHYTSTPNCKYRPDVIHYNYDVNKARFYDSTPDKFFLFFPGDWHIAKVNNDTNDQKIKVIVIKIDYID